MTHQPLDVNTMVEILQNGAVVGWGFATSLPPHDTTQLSLHEQRWLLKSSYQHVPNMSTEMNWRLASHQSVITSVAEFLSWAMSQFSAGDRYLKALSATYAVPSNPVSPTAAPLMGPGFPQPPVHAKRELDTGTVIVIYNTLPCANVYTESSSNQSSEFWAYGSQFSTPQQTPLVFQRSSVPSQPSAHAFVQDAVIHGLLNDQGLRFAMPDSFGCVMSNWYESVQAGES